MIVEIGKLHAIERALEQVYTTKAATAVSWFQEHARRSVELIRRAGVAKDASIVDVGGGASTLTDDLLAEGYSKLTVVDLSAAALSATKERLGAQAKYVLWVIGDITHVELPRHAYDVRHDGAVFHFLTTREERVAYIRAVLHAVKPGGHVIVATFAEDGPEQCGGLPVMRYSADALHLEFGVPFTLLKHELEQHHTPFGTIQKFIYCLCRKETN